MARLSSEIKSVFSKQDVFPVATASSDGTPNVVPMTFVKILDDDKLLIVDNFMNKTKKNIDTNPIMAVSIWDMQTGKSYQIKGSTTVVDSGSVFEEAQTWVKEKMPQLQPKGAVILTIEKIYDCSPFGPTLGQEL
ncbi:pyridoxamine 5'-phosphate oxidase family protein [Dehalobacter sp. DCM]|uniref:pyridoxamine 5'-phosphate oxidase family protein n=1 Tax=Dehalobacter sp. DCM TaxID=2907827 RepID=UPI0030816997|nr:pyridoxamine 5'-phosphate oxidase family protein [Dehalobacter sp. DCM]